MKNRILLLVAVFVLPLTMWANNIRVKLNSYTATANASIKTLNLTVAWDNSWHDGSGTFRDAAYIFVKYKDVTSPEWQHAILQLPGNSTNDTLNTPNVQFDLLGKNSTATPLPSGYRGLIVRRKKGASTPVLNNPEYAGVYNVAMNITVSVVLPTGVSLANPEFRVYGLEMVDVPTGPFYLGDGSYGSLFHSSQTNSTSPIYVTSDSAFTAGYGSSYTYTYPATFPKGFSEFYCMKYELSCEGYAEFLNTLTRIQQNTFAPSAFASLNSGSLALGYPLGLGITGTSTSMSSPAVMTASTPYKAIALGSSLAFVAYLDWAALRPMTQPEYEKACRGPLVPVPGEWACGSGTYTDVFAPDVDINGANESYSASVNSPRASVSSTTGAFRCGAFAKPTGSTRLNSGGTYYGIMEMSGNANEITVGDVNYLGQNGDGSLSQLGNTDVSNWNTLNECSTREGSVSSQAPSLNFYNGAIGGFNYSIRGVIK